MNNTGSKKIIQNSHRNNWLKQTEPTTRSTSDQQLGEDFAAFLLNKIQNIRKLF